jgi:putative transposase
MRSLTFKRKRIRLSRESYLGRQIYFVTACFAERMPFGSQPTVARWLIRELRKHSAAAKFSVHAYCVMPDHMHFLVEGDENGSDLVNFVSFFKQQTAYVLRSKRKQRLWQTKFYDHILRPTNSLDQVAWYIWLNPVRKGIASDVSSFPLSGSFTEAGQSLQMPQTGWVPPWRREKSKMPG